MKAAAIIAAAGIGRRMGGATPKQYLEIGGRPVICHTLDKFARAKLITDVIIAVEPGKKESFSKEIIEAYGFPKNWKVVEGGKVRQESVANALKLVPPDCDVVLVHDGVRPFVKPGMIDELVETARKNGACILAAPVKDTLKKANAAGSIETTVEREGIYGAQTPQACKTQILREAFAAAEKDGIVATDESALIERLGVKVGIVCGDNLNIKITTPEDMLIAEGILKNWK